MLQFQRNTNTQLYTKMLTRQLQAISKRALHISTKTLAAKAKDPTAINPSEASHFSDLASSWWDETGSQRILHKMNLLRMDFINKTIKTSIQLNKGVTNPEQMVFIPGWNFNNLLPDDVSSAIQKEIDNSVRSKSRKLQLKCLDVGCGGGILSECLARLPMVSSVKGIDMTKNVIKVAKKHMKLDPSLEKKLSYEMTSLEHVPKTEMFDVVTMMELLEHVDYPATVVKQALSHVAPGGYLFLSTINRDFISWFTTIFMGEHVLNIVPVGTHTYSKYIKQSEIKKFMNQFRDRFKVVDLKGCAYFPAVGWFFTGIQNMGNYMMAIRRIK